MGGEQKDREKGRERKGKDEGNAGKMTGGGVEGVPQGLVPQEIDPQEVGEEDKRQADQMTAEKELLFSYYQAERLKLEENRRKLTDKICEINDVKERSDVELVGYQSEVQRYMIQCLDELVRHHVEAEADIRAQTEHHLTGEVKEMKETKYELEKDVRDIQRRHQSMLFALREKQDDEIRKISEEFDRKVKELQAQYEYRAKSVRMKLDAETKHTVDELSAERESQVTELRESHSKQYQELKNYFTDLTHSNLDLIRNLKEELVELKKKESVNEKTMSEIAERNKKLSEPLREALRKIEELKHEEKSYQELKVKFKNLKLDVTSKEKKKKDLEWKLEVLTQKLDIISEKKQGLEAQLQEVIDNVQLSNEVKNLMLQNRIQVLLTGQQRKPGSLPE